MFYSVSRTLNPTIPCCVFPWSWLQSSHMESETEFSMLWILAWYHSWHHQWSLWVTVRIKSSNTSILIETLLSSQLTHSFSCFLKQDILCWTSSISKDTSHCIPVSGRTSVIIIFTGIIWQRVSKGIVIVSRIVAWSSCSVTTIWMWKLGSPV